MESIIARALEYTLRYWLKSFSRDQFKLQGRTALLSNLDINGDALHSSVGLPPALNVATAKVGTLQITLPSVSNVQVEPIVVQIDRLDLVLEENLDVDASRSSCSTPSSSSVSTSSGWGSGYGFADKIADGMTLEVSTVNLLIETRGGSKKQGSAAWASPLASITIHNLLLYTTNENWQAVNLKEARDFFSNSKYIYVFKKLQWESLSIDLLPHPDMFTEANLVRAQEGANQRDDDGAKRVFFGGERFIEGISGEAYITVKRTELNRPLGLEVQLHVTEAVCPALSEPGLRALLRFLTGFYVCLNRADMDLNAQQRSVEAAGHSLVSMVVDHIFLCIKDAEYKLELLMQSLHFSRASVCDGETANNLTKLSIGGLFLRDTFARPPCTLAQPSMLTPADDSLHIPEFATNFCPPIYPLGTQEWQSSAGVPLVCLHSLQVNPSPKPPSLASETVINCQPLELFLQEESCLRIFSFLADGIVVSPGDIQADSSVNSLFFKLNQLDLTVPLEVQKQCTSRDRNCDIKSHFTGAKLLIKNLSFSESPFLKLRLLKLEKDPACFCLWPDQPVDASQKKWSAEVSLLTLSLESPSEFNGVEQFNDNTVNQFECIVIKDASIQAAMLTSDGKPIKEVPPPGGIVRIGVSFQQYFSNTSVEQLFFVLDLYAYVGKVADKIALAGKKSSSKTDRDVANAGRLLDKVPSDTAVSLRVSYLQLRFLESSSLVMAIIPLAQFIGEDFSVKVSHRTLGGAMVVSSNLRWERVQVDCVDTGINIDLKNHSGSSVDNHRLGNEDDIPQLKAVLWTSTKYNIQSNGRKRSLPFLDLSMVQVIPFSEQDAESHRLDVSASISGVRLSGGMAFAESLLHRFGILGPDGGPGEGLLKGLDNLSSGPLAKLFKPSEVVKSNVNGDNMNDYPKFTNPDNVDVRIDLRNWLFALEGPIDMLERWQDDNCRDSTREKRCWHANFHSFWVEARRNHVQELKEKAYTASRHLLESVVIGVEGLQVVKPLLHGEAHLSNGIKEDVYLSDGVNFEVRIIPVDNDAEDNDSDNEMDKWAFENMKFSVKNPIEAIVTKNELQNLALTCKSEVDSMGRITAGIIRLLKLEGSVGQAAIHQLSNLGSQGLEKILTPDRLSSSRFSSPSSFSLPPPPNLIAEPVHLHANSTMASLEETILDSQAKCAALMNALSGSEATHEHLLDAEQLAQNLKSMQNLLKQLRVQI
ncbi:hypothetical protein MLD38_024932 [Melastoma candidum]|uniref:Uncharacterized protein n=1 Tax=Melastoma candidum TaxID=119954 RepID=A0ACB9NU90_9MYRT|nr:hypothetical protein MLD38_024932 [Melastoma candidum]